MSFLFDPESLMFTMDWSPIENWFEQRAKEAGHSKYSHSEIVSVPCSISPEIDKVASEMSYKLGRVLSELLKESLQ